MLQGITPKTYVTAVLTDNVMQNYLKKSEKMNKIR